MMKTETQTVVLSTEISSGEKLEVTYLPWRGMNFISYKKGNIEVIDQSTKSLFEETYAGLGAFIGPHFHHRNPKVIPPVKDESLFPHIAIAKARGSDEPFAHGIGRYAPWKVEEMSDQYILATLKGADEWKGIKLKEIEGQDFTMQYRAELTQQGLLIDLSVISDTDSIVGLHTYYALCEGKGTVIAKVQPHYVDQREQKSIPSSWNYSKDQTLTYPLEEATDWGFHPFPDPLQGEILLETKTHQLKVSYFSDNQENSWQLWHPKGASFVCIEPLSAKIPRQLHLSVSKIKILISIL